MVVKCGDKRKKTCNGCNGLKEINYMNDTHCAACRSDINKLKRKQEREEKGKQPYGSGRSIYCSTCKKEKEPGRENESRCKKCKSDAYKANRAKKRAEKGLPEWGSGRSPNCYDCKILKENINMAYCYSCARKRDREWRVRTGRSLKNRTGKCQCGQPFASYSNCYCVSCASKWRKNYLKSNPDVKKRMYRNRNEKIRKDPTEIMKANVRSITGRAIKRGELLRENCEVCGANEKIEAHHDDYTKPLDVRWLCKKHHAEHHKQEKVDKL